MQCQDEGTKEQENKGTKKDNLTPLLLMQWEQGTGDEVQHLRA